MVLFLFKNKSTTELVAYLNLFLVLNVMKVFF